nr:hypothetical protein [Desulfobulbaceae bacterium]
MSIVDINSLLSTIPSYPVSSGVGSFEQALKPRVEQPENKDRFTRGQYWRNQAVSSGFAGLQGAANTYSRSNLVARVRPSQGESAPFLEESSKPVSPADGKKSTEISSSDQEKLAPNEPTKPTGEALTQSEKAILESLKKADQAVRVHEMAHLAAAGGLAKGGATFKMQKGPDGQSYAVGGEVQIDMSKGETPEITVQKMRTVRRAALAPADPSPQDQKVAAQATINIAQATQELNLSKAQSGEAKDPQAEKVSDDQDRLSAGSVYREFGQALTQQNSPGPREASSLRQNIASYGQAPSLSPSNLGASAVNIVV